MPPPSGSASTSMVANPGPGAGDRERGGRGRGAGTPAAADHADARSPHARTLGHVSQPLREVSLGVREEEHLFGAELDPALPHVRVVEVSSDEQQTVTSLQHAGAGDGGRDVVTDDHQGGRG